MLITLVTCKHVVFQIFLPLPAPHYPFHFWMHRMQPVLPSVGTGNGRYNTSGHGVKIEDEVEHRAAVKTLKYTAHGIYGFKSLYMIRELNIY